MSFPNFPFSYEYRKDLVLHEKVYPREKIERVKNLKMEEGDVVVVTYLKAGMWLTNYTKIQYTYSVSVVPSCVIISATSQQDAVVLSAIQQTQSFIPGKESM